MRGKKLGMPERIDVINGKHTSADRLATWARRLRRLGGANPQQIVEMHDADRSAGFDDKHRSDLG